MPFVTDNRTNGNTYGGGIKIAGGGLTLEDCTTTANWARRGAGVYAENTTQTITVTDCAIDNNNSANGETGAGVCLPSVEATAVFTRISISGSTSGDSGGGATNGAPQLCRCR